MMMLWYFIIGTDDDDEAEADADEEADDEADADDEAEAAAAARFLMRYFLSLMRLRWAYYT